MALGRCPDCDTLREITPTGERQAPDTSFSSTWWRVVLHKHPEKPEVCDGSGKRV